MAVYTFYIIYVCLLGQTSSPRIEQTALTWLRLAKIALAFMPNNQSPYSFPFPCFQGYHSTTIFWDHL